MAAMYAFDCPLVHCFESDDKAPNARAVSPEDVDIRKEDAAAIVADENVVCVMIDGSGYSDTITCNAVALITYPPFETPSGLVTRA